MNKLAEKAFNTHSLPMQALLKQHSFKIISLSDAEQIIREEIEKIDIE